MNCGVPFCQSALQLKGMVTGCPLHNLIPEWNDELYHDRPQQALIRLLKTNPFPEFTGRVCPALCEKACICGMNDEPVTIHENELAIIEEAYASGWMKPRPTRRQRGPGSACGRTAEPLGPLCGRLSQRGDRGLARPTGDPR